MKSYFLSFRVKVLFHYYGIYIILYIIVNNYYIFLSSQSSLGYSYLSSFHMRSLHIFRYGTNTRRWDKSMRFKQVRNLPLAARHKSRCEVVPMKRFLFNRFRLKPRDRWARPKARELSGNIINPRQEKLTAFWFEPSPLLPPVGAQRSPDRYSRCARPKSRSRIITRDNHTETSFRKCR